MAEAAAGIQLTLLGSADIVDEARLPELYKYPDDLANCWVRANFISTLDGSASVDGKSGGLGGPGDRALFRLMRELADVIVVGAGTVRAENYSGAQLTVTQRQDRQAVTDHGLDARQELVSARFLLRGQRRGGDHAALGEAIHLDGLRKDAERMLAK